MRLSHLAGAAKAVLLATLSRLSPQEIREVAWMAAAISAPSSLASRLEDNPPQAIYGSPFGSSELVVPPNYLTHSSLQAAWAPDASAYTIYLDDNGVRQFKCNWLYCPRCTSPLRANVTAISVTLLTLTGLWRFTAIQGRLSNFWDHYETHNPDRKVFRCEWPGCVATRTRERELKRHAQTHLDRDPATHDPAKALNEEDLEQEQGASS